MSDEARVRELLRSHGLGQGDPAKLLKCLDLWRFYARSMNLLGPAEVGDALFDHVDEALCAVEVARTCGLESAPWLDVGAGAGLPGLVVAAVRPAARLDLVEPRAKRVSFLRMALGAMGRGDVTVWAGRVDGGSFSGEGCGPVAGSFGVLSARAVFEPSVWLEQALPWLRPGGVVLLHLAEDAKAPALGEGLVVAGEASAGRWRVVGVRRVDGST